MSRYPFSIISRIAGRSRGSSPGVSVTGTSYCGMITERISVAHSRLSGLASL